MRACQHPRSLVLRACTRLHATELQKLAISRNYKVRLKLGIEVGGKKFRHKIASDVKEMKSAPV
jgi:hypothetical protein